MATFVALIIEELTTTWENPKVTGSPKETYSGQ